MYTLPLLVLAACSAFLYRAKHPDRQKTPTAASNGRRFRLALGLITMILCTSAAYRAPIEMGEVITSAQTRQAELQNKKLEQRMVAERQHIQSLIETLGGIDNYRAYLQSEKAQSY